MTSISLTSYPVKDLSYEAMQQATILSKAARPLSLLHCLSDHGYTPLRAEQRMTERQVLARIRDGLTDYSQGTLHESVENFLQQALSFHPTSMTEVASKRSLEATFIATDSQRELYIRVFCSTKEKEEIPNPDYSKAYATRDTHFVRQLAGANLMHSLRLTCARAQEHLAVGLCKIDGNNYYLIAGPNLPGKDMDSLHAEIFKHPKESGERAKAISLFKRALEKLAITLGEMHSFKATPQKITPEILSAFQTRIDSKLKAYQKAGGDQLERIKAVMEKQMAELSASQAYLTYYHGTANLRKFFYNAETDTLMMKDLCETHPSMGLKDEPLGLFAGHDIASPLQDILFETLLHESEESTLSEELCETFNAIYRKTVGNFFQPGLCQIERSLRRLEKYPGCLNPGDDPFKKKSLELCNRLFIQDQ